MQKIDKLVTNPQQIVERQSQQQLTTTTGQLTSDQRDSVAYFFLRLANVYGSKYLQQWPNEEAIKLAKREWATQIGAYGRSQIDAMFNYTKSQLVAGEPDWQWPEIGRILGCANQSWEHKRIERAEEEWRGIRNEWRLGDLTKQERRKQAAKRELAKMKSLFGGAS